MSYSLKDVASLLVLIFFAAQFCLIFKETNIGLFIVASLSELINKFQFTGLLLVVVTFLVVAILLSLYQWHRLRFDVTSYCTYVYAKFNDSGVC